VSGFGIYVHVPFCGRRCDYCDFATWTDRHHLMDGYVGACVDEIGLARRYEALPPATSVFFGGGTPSLLAPQQLCRVLGAIERVADAEVTVECNPENITPDLLSAYRAGGVTRISLGVQSMVGHVLDSLGRVHRPEAVPEAVAMIGEAGFASFNVDLIFGAAGESDDDWRRTLAAALALSPSPPHVSAYALTVEPGTPLWRDPARYPDEDAQARRYEIADAVLAEAGLGWYEISNWARPGHECGHNLLYWEQGDYRGFGCAAHSHRDGHRFWNVRTPDRYIALVAGAVASAGAGPVVAPAMGGEEHLDDDTRSFEALELALRTSAGVPAATLPSANDELDGLVETTDERVTLTVRGRLLANAVAVRLRPVQPG
jgi:putative oxygen-independent coproporphyrinogen III oxidase